jgi:chromosome segregation ATPase
MASQFSSGADALNSTAISHVEENILDGTYGSLSGGGSASSSSKAVLAALRALQDKIRRLESERTQALDESAQLRHQLKNQEIEGEHGRQRESLSHHKAMQEVRTAYERVHADKSELELRLAGADEKFKRQAAEAADLQSRVRAAEQELHEALMKARDSDHVAHQQESNVKIAVQKQEGE